MSTIQSYPTTKKPSFPNLATYHQGQNTSIIIRLEEGILKSFFQIHNAPNISFKEYPIKLIYPFDAQTLAQNSPETISFCLDHFSIKLQSNQYTLFPVLRGGGRTQFQRKARPYHTSITSKEKEQLAQEKKSDLSLFLRDRYQEKAFNLPKIALDEGNFDTFQKSLPLIYKKIFDNALNKIKEDDPHKLQLSSKNFKKYLQTLLPEVEQDLVEDIFFPSPSQEKKESKNKSRSSQTNPSESHKLKTLFENLDKAIQPSSEIPSIPSKLLLISLIKNGLLKKNYPYQNLDSHPFYNKLASKITRLYLTHKGAPTSLQFLMDLPYDQALKAIEKHTLRRMPWTEYTTSLLVKHYNLIVANPDKKDPIDQRNKDTIEQIVKACIQLYRDKEDILSEAEFTEIIPLAGIKHRSQSKDPTLFRELLSALLADISNDPLFEPLKIEGLATVLLYVIQDTKNQYCEADDLKRCLDVLHVQMSHLLFTSNNSNMQRCMDALNLVLQIMGYKKIDGMKKEDIINLETTLNTHIPSASKRAFNFLGGGKDPSLDFKAKYAKEALKRIGTQETALSNEEEAILKGAPAVFSIAKGVFTLDVDAVLNGAKTLTEIGKDLEQAVPKKWFDEINHLQATLNLEFDSFQSLLVDKKSPLNTTKNLPEYFFFLIEGLHRLAKDPTYPIRQRQDATQLLFEFHRFIQEKGSLASYKKDFSLLIQKHLSDLANTPLEAHDSHETPLAELARYYLLESNLAPLETPPFSYTTPTLQTTNSFLQEALKNYQSLESALSTLQKNCQDHYRQEIAPLHLIPIEGKKYLNKIPQDRQYPLCDPALLTHTPFSQESALTEFLERSYPVWLIQGDAGMGKSILLKLIEHTLWKSHTQGLTPYLPLFVRLSEVKNPNHCIEETLQKYHYSKTLIQEMQKRGKEGTIRYLFIFDGYDELKAPKNLYKENQLQNFGPHTKLIITSRQEYLKAYGDYPKYFKPESHSTLFETCITNVSDEQIQIYLKKTAEANKAAIQTLDPKTDQEAIAHLEKFDTVEEYNDTIQSIQGLRPLMKSPYMLKIIIDIIPLLMKQKGRTPTKSSIYKTFTMEHFSKEAERLLHREPQNVPRGYDPERSFYAYSKDLAFSMWLQNLTSVTSESNDYVMQEEFYFSSFKKEAPQEGLPFQEKSFQRFFTEDAKTRLARQGAQLIIVDQEARFTHKSILEYFVARFLYEKIKHASQSNWKDVFQLKPLKGSSSTDQESDVLQFLIEMLLDNHYQQVALKQGGIQEEEGVHALENLAKILTSHQQELLNPQETWHENIILIVESLEKIPSAKLCQSLSQFYNERSKLETRNLEEQQNDQERAKSYQQQALNCVLSGAYEGETQIENSQLIAEGQGTWKAFETETKYEGQWEKNHFHGEGKLSLPNGSTYEGTFDQGKKNGKGTVLLPKESPWEAVQDYKGQWQEDQLIEGALTLKTGTTVKGVLEELRFTIEPQELVRLVQEKKIQEAETVKNIATNPTLYQDLERTEEGKEVIRTLKIGNYPLGCFGPDEWKKYFGKVTGGIPPLPKEIHRILSEPCAFWPDKKVYETHLLVLIPSAVNGKAFTLNTLEELIQNPKTGNKTQYKYYDDNVKKELGNKSQSSHWILMTRDVIPDSRNKTYSDQQALIKGPYAVPGALEIATGILMHHAQTGERLYSDNPNTYTRCEEKLSNGCRVVVGSFGSSGLFVYDDLHSFLYGDNRNDNCGLCGARKF